MPDFTYLQAAQPTTAGHWLLSFAHPALRDATAARRRLRRAPISARPGRAASTARASRSTATQLATRLGFDAPIEHTRDAMWQTDALTETVWHAATAATNASRFAEDVELYGSDEFGLLAIGDELCRASALMPQKRNPYALVVIRGARGHAARPRDRRARHPAHAVRAHGQPALRLRRGLRRGRSRHPRRRPRGRHRREPADRPRGVRAGAARELRAGHRRRRGPLPSSTASTTARRTASSAAPSRMRS